MIAGTGLFNGLNRRNDSLRISSSKVKRSGGIAVALLATLLLAGSPAEADEFDPFVVYSEARPLNDRWQACAASFVRPRLQSQQSPEALAKEALDSCRPEERNLLNFFVDKIGRRSAENVMSFLREKYQSDLAAAIRELRARE